MPAVATKLFTRASSKKINTLRGGLDKVRVDVGKEEETGLDSNSRSIHLGAETLRGTHWGADHGRVPQGAKVMIQNARSLAPSPTVSQNHTQGLA